jgi:putative ABC transport system substrate-binding protein
MDDDGPQPWEKQMRRREFICVMAGAAAWPLPLSAQESGTPKRLGVLAGAFTSKDKGWFECFVAGLRDLGWIEGKNVSIEYRWTEGISERYPLLAAELVRLNPDLILASTTPGAQAVQRATRTIPIVFISVSDPVTSGIVASFARPQGNLTGVSNFQPSMSGKLLELLKAAAPNASRFGVLHNPSNAGKVLEVHELQAGGQVLGVVIEPLEVRSTDDFERTFLVLARSSCNALITLADGVTIAHRQRIVDYAKRNRLPTIFQISEFAKAGGLMSYGVNYCHHYRRAATYVDKILKGAKPADLPVELPSTYELVINLKTARALDLTIPKSLLISADEVIE